jgi:neutral ceramidase
MLQADMRAPQYHFNIKLTCSLVEIVAPHQAVSCIAWVRQKSFSPATIQMIACHSISNPGSPRPLNPMDTTYMANPRHLFILVFPLTFCWVAANPSTVTAELRVGFGQVTITPERPTPMAGYYGKRLSTETHDSLWARTTVLDDGGTKVALISLDLISTTKWLVDETRNLIVEKTKIPSHCVLITASHSHTGPVLFDPSSSRYNRFGNEDPSAKQYILELPKKIATSVEMAVASLKPMTVRHAISSEPKLAFNRRFFMNDGTVGWNPGKLNPRVVREAGPTDDSLPMVAFYGKDERVAGLLTNFSIHLDTVGGTQWSADMPYSLEQSLSRVFGGDCHFQYTTGCCGDVNHIDVRHAFPQKGHEEAARIGTRLAGAVLRGLNDLAPIQSTRLHATNASLSIPLAQHTKERVEWANGIAERANDEKPPAFREMVEAFRILDVEARKGESLQVEVQVISLGKEIAWVGLPGEIFVQLGLSIKDGSPFSSTILSELSNGSIGYVPTRQAYAQGNYEVISARCAEGSGEMMVDSALMQLRAHFETQIRRP